MSLSRKLRRIPKSIYFSGVFLLTSIFGFLFPLGNQTASPSSHVKWLSNINDSEKIRNIAIPGTHDTIALHNFLNVSGKCQSLPLRDQLNIGIRFLDIRLKEVDNKLYGCHSYVDQKISFEEICNTLETFLNEYNREVIFMSVKEDYDSSNSTITFEEALKTYQTDKWYVGTTIPENIGAVRGKIVLFSRFENNNYGIDMSNGWLDSTTMTLPNDSYVQDYYEVENIEEKKAKILDCLNETGHELKINFLSGYLAHYTIPSSAASVAKDINPWINGNIKLYNDRGIVLYDYVTTREMDAWFK